MTDTKITHLTSEIRILRDRLDRETRTALRLRDAALLHIALDESLAALPVDAPGWKLEYLEKALTRSHEDLACQIEDGLCISFETLRRAVNIGLPGEVHPSVKLLGRFGKVDGRPALRATCSHPSDHAPSGHGALRFDQAQKGKAA